MGIAEKLKEALVNGEVLRIVYNGGSQPGTVREIAPIKVSDNEVRARCYLSGSIKTYKIEKIELVSSDSNANSYVHNSIKQARTHAPLKREQLSDFVAIDVETANADLASICQIGIVGFDKGGVVYTWKSLVNPEDYFDGVNVSIHGIDEKSVEGSPTILDVYEDLMSNLSGRIVVSHTSFDRVAITRASERYNLEVIRCTWLDSARVVRRAWPEFSRKGYGLANVTKKLGIQFNHHDALEDARAAGEIIVRATQDTGIEIADWLNRVKQPISQNISTPTSITREIDDDGALFEEEVVFTGALSMPRSEAKQLATVAGCEVASTVKKSTTLLVVGDQDIKRLAGHKKSAKHRKAEELIERGQSIRILTEGDFQRLVGI